MCLTDAPIVVLINKQGVAGKVEITYISNKVGQGVRTSFNYGVMSPIYGRPNVTPHLKTVFSLVETSDVVTRQYSFQFVFIKK